MEQTQEEKFLKYLNTPKQNDHVYWIMYDSNNEIKESPDFIIFNNKEEFINFGKYFITDILGVKIENNRINSLELGKQMCNTPTGKEIAIEIYTKMLSPIYYEKHILGFLISFDESGNYRGIAQIYMTNDKSINVENLCSKNEKNGSGRAIINRLKTYAQQNKVIITIKNPLDDAKEFYKKLGFDDNYRFVGGKNGLTRRRKRKHHGTKKRITSNLIKRSK